MSTINDVKTGSCIEKHGDYLVTLGEKLHIFSLDGKLIRTAPDVRWPHQVHFLSDDRIITIAHMYFYCIDLRTGSILWKSRMLKGRKRMESHFAVSTDQKLACWIGANENLHVIDLQTGQITEHPFPMPDCHSATDVIFTEDGSIRVLYEGGFNKGPANEHDNWMIAIGFADVDPATGEIQWKMRLETDNPMYYYARFLGSPNKILSCALFCYDVTTEIWEDYLENSPEIPYERDHTFLFEADASGRYYSVILSTRGEIVVDILQRKIVSIYADVVRGYHSGVGTVVGDSFWQWDGKHFIQKPFPLFEDLLPERYVHWH